MPQATLPVAKGMAPDATPVSASPSPSEDDMVPAYLGRQPSEAGLRSMANRFRTKTLVLTGPPEVPQNDAERILQRLCPDLSQASLRRVRQEKISREADVAALDKEDLQQLGLPMVQRARILHWSHTKRSQSSGEEEEPFSFPPFEFERAQSAEEVEAATKLDILESDGNFWCELIYAWSSPEQTSCQCVIDASQLPGQSVNNIHDDFREDLLESLFDLSPERIFEVFESNCSKKSMHQVLGTGHQFVRALSAYGLPEPDRKTRQKILTTVCKNPEVGLQLQEFEAVVSRTVLARLVTCIEQRPSSLRCLKVTDYGARSIEPENSQPLSESKCRQFFFGHRPMTSPDGGVRWVHVTGLELSVVLALAVKYSLHPLAVEDTIQQNPCKIDRYGDHYFGTIERISLTQKFKEGEVDGEVEVLGHHVSFFCSGAPRMDTVITVCQEDQSFEKEWPGVGTNKAPSALQRPELYLAKIEKRLRQPMSRLRERRANFFVHAVLDICADEISDVVRAFGNRLQALERDANAGNEMDAGGAEAAKMRVQLALVDRRAKSLQRVLRRLMADSDFSEGMASYLHDVVDHLEEARDDSGRLAEKCIGIQHLHDRLAELEQDNMFKKQELVRAKQADRLNNILFVLTLVTTIFCPVQFLCGVYGMNFVDEDGRPTIPELLWRHAYLYFWLIVVSYLIAAFASAAYLYRFFKSVDAASDGKPEKRTGVARRRRLYHSLSTEQLLDGDVEGGANHHHHPL